MKLWGWLDPDHVDPLAGAPMVEAWLARSLGLSALTPTPPVALDPSSVPAPRLSEDARAALVSALGSSQMFEDGATRAALSVGQSYPDQLARRSGRLPVVADLVVRPRSIDDLMALLSVAETHGLRITPVGGATSVVGGLDAPADPRPLVVADMRGMDRILGFGEGTVTVEAGIGLVALEKALVARGLTLGHFPQSFEGATLGGSIMANGSGQRSDGYGRLSDNLLSARLVTPRGLWATERCRHGAGGPWLGGLVSGSEGLFGILADVTLRVHPAPAHVEDRAWLMPSLEAAMGAMRALSGAGLSMMRVSDAAETAFLSAFRLARRGLEQPPALERLVLSFKGAARRPVLALAGHEGARAEGKAALARAHAAFTHAGGAALGARPGASWRRTRYEAPHLRESIMARGLGVDTFETAAPWADIVALHAGVRDAISAAVLRTLDGRPGRPVVFAHLGHSYPEGSCVYFTAIFPLAADPLAQWRIIKTAATDAIIAHGGALSHHHGMGADHAPWAAAEKGELGLKLLAALRAELDPNGVMATGMAKALPLR